MATCTTKDSAQIYYNERGMGQAMATIPGALLTCAAASLALNESRHRT
jgi:hypothetical protein